MITDLESAIKLCEEEEKKQRSKAHVYEDMMVFNQAIKHNSEAEYYEELLNECIECASDHRQIAELLRELKYYKDRQDLINKSWQELINYKEGIEKIKMRSQVYQELGENILASGMEQALDILEEVNADGR